MTHSLKIGDKITIANMYKRRSFKQWLLRKPQELAIFYITTTNSAAHESEVRDLGNGMILVKKDKMTYNAETDSWEGKC